MHTHPKAVWHWMIGMITLLTELTLGLQMSKDLASLRLSPTPPLQTWEYHMHDDHQSLPLIPAPLQKQLSITVHKRDLELSRTQ